MKMIIRQITAEETYPVRHAELRKGLPFKSAEMDADSQIGSIHLGGFIDNKLIAVCSFFFAPYIPYPGYKSLQLRGMAVLEEFQGNGYGSLLIRFAEEWHMQRGVRLIWMNARTPAIPFYENLKYEKQGEEFEVAPHGPHYIMHKILI